MKRQMKIAAVVSATALLAIGASFTSMAAAKTGTWAQEDGVWYCYDKNGDAYENEFCMSNGVELYVGEDGALVTDSWVEYDGNMYYIGSAGTKTVNNWKLLTPYEDEDADEEWYYFGAAGKRVEGTKKAIASAEYGTETFYFDKEGKVIYGWVDTVAYEQADDADVNESADGNYLENLVYTNERGARVQKSWFKAYEPKVNVEEDDLDGVTQKWYYAKSLGNPVTGKASNIDGETYFFTNEGIMLTGWVGFDGTDYKSIDDKNAAAISAQTTIQDVYFACTVDGHVKKNKWIYEWSTDNFYNADPDVAKDYFWLGKDGKVFVPQNATEANAVEFVSGGYDDATDSNAEFKTINNNVFLFNEDGEMMSGLVKVGSDRDLFYLGGAHDGARKIGAQTIADDMGDSYKFYFGTEDDNGYEMGVAVTGAKNGKLYNNGILVVANNEYKYQEVIADNGLSYIVNKSGSIQTSSKKYTDDDFTLDASGYKFSTEAGTVKGSILPVEE